MTDLERKLAEALRGQAGEVTPHLDAAWAEQMRRQRKPRRRRAAVWVAPLAAALVVLTSVLLATQLKTTPAPPGAPQALEVAPAEYHPLADLRPRGLGVQLVEVAGQTDSWITFAFVATAASAPGRNLFCVEAVPKGRSWLDAGAPQYGTKSPSCTPIGRAAVSAGYLGEAGGPLPPGRALYLAGPAVHGLRLFDAEGELGTVRKMGWADSKPVFLADVKPDSPPVRFQVR